VSDKLPPTVTQWLADLDRQGKSGSTINNYRRALGHFSRWSQQSYGEPFDPAGIIPRDVADWKSYQQTVEKAKPATCNLRLVALSRFFKWALARGHTDSDPTAEIQSIRPEQRQPVSLKKPYVRRLRREIKRSGNKRDADILEMLLGAGLRGSELLALRREDVVLGERSGEVIIRYGKGGLYRRVPLTKDVRQAVEAYLATQPDIKEEEPLWQGERGPLKDRSSIFYILKKHAFRAGLDESRVSPHKLRHTFATRYLAANPDDLRGLAAILGHSNLNTVMIYTEPTTEDLAERMERVK